MNGLKRVFANFKAKNEITSRITWLRNQFSKTQSKKHSIRKTIGCFAETIGCLYQFTNIKTEFKELKDRENAHRGLYWFTLNQELHPVFPKTIANTLSNQP